MPITPTTGVPDQFTAGDTVPFNVTVSADYTADDDWRASIYWTSPAMDRRIKTTSETTTGVVFAFTLDPSESAEFSSAGRWSWVLKVEDADGQAVTVCGGTTNVIEDQSGAVPGVSFARRMVAALEARMEGRVTADSESISYLGVSVSQIPIDRVAALLDRFRAELAIELDIARKRRGQPARNFTSRVSLRG